MLRDFCFAGEASTLYSLERKKTRYPAYERRTYVEWLKTPVQGGFVVFKLVYVKMS